MIYTIKNGTTEIKISSLGAEVRSVIHKGKERAWQNETGEWAGCAILLFPFAGFNRLIYDGVDFGISKHGFCRNEEFKLIAQDENSIELSLGANERTRTVYPYDFTFNVRYTLTPRGYEVTYIVKNPSNREIPFAAGGHESFALDKEVRDYYVEFERDEKFDFLVHNSQGMLTGETVNHGEGRTLSLEREFTDNSATVILRNINSRKATLREKGTDEKIVEITFDGFSNLLLWHPHGSKMLCIEPWQTLPSYADEIKEFKTRDGVRCLCAGEKISFTRAISY